MKDNDVYQKAKKRVQAKFGFFTHLTVYILVNSFLMTMKFVHIFLYNFFFDILYAGKRQNTKAVKQQADPPSDQGPD